MSTATMEEKSNMKRRVGVEGALASEKRTTTTTIMDLPDKILKEEILRRIRGPEDLWNMTIVSKRWNSLFKSMTNPFSGLKLVTVDSPNTTRKLIYIRFGNCIKNG